MRSEVDEHAATGDIARIFAEVRQLWGVPYVSAIHRQMAATPGLLEWAWEAVAPVFRDGRAQGAAWAAAEHLTLAPLAPIADERLAAWAIDAAALATIRATLSGFVRVAPVNMMMAALVRQILAGEATGGAAASVSVWMPPTPLPEPPAMVDIDRLPAAERDNLLRLATLAAAGPFVPGLYRMLAHWPQLMAHLAEVLPARLRQADAVAAFETLRQRIDARVPEITAALPPAAGTYPAPGSEERARFLASAAVYRKTSPELVVVGKLLLAALPATCVNRFPRIKEGLVS